MSRPLPLAERIELAPVFDVIRPDWDDPCCPRCGARVCWYIPDSGAGAMGHGYCILSGWSSLGRDDCAWRGQVIRTRTGVASR